jgi:hypothetical protein
MSGANTGKETKGLLVAAGVTMRQSLLLAATALFLLNFNVLGTATVTRRYSQDLTYAWFGDQPWLYPRATSAASRDAVRAPVVVVIIDEPALSLRSARWPVPMQFHAAFLAELAVLAPRAIMLDFLLIDPAPPADTCAFLSLAGQLRDHGMPLYLAVTRLGDLAVLDAAHCQDSSGRPILAASVLTPVAVHKQSDGSDFVNRTYPFEMRGSDDSRGSGLPSAAVRMYCDGRPVPAACWEQLARAYASDAGFDLAWSPAGAPFNQRWAATPCDLIPSPGRAILYRQVLPRETACPPVPTLFASALLSPAEDSTLGMQNETLFDLVGGSFVFVGGNFRGSGDLMTTPMHTLLPGVYYHAVALENLLAFHGEPKVRKQFRQPRIAFYAYDLLVLWALAGIFLWRQRWVQRRRRRGESPFDLSARARDRLSQLTAKIPTPIWVLALVLTFLVLAAYPPLQLIAVSIAIVAVVAVELHIAPSAEVRDRARAMGYYWAALALSLAVIALAIWIGYRWLRLPPGDWIGYLSFSAFGFFVAHVAILEFEHRVAEARRARRRSGGSL